MNPQESLLEKLTQYKLITKEQAEIIAKKQKESGSNAVELLVGENILQEKQIITFLVNNCGFHYINLENIDIDQQAVSAIPIDLIKELKVIPIRCARNMLVVTMMDPYDCVALKRLSEASVFRVIPFVGQQKQIMDFIENLSPNSYRPKPVTAASLVSGMPFVEKYTFENFVVGKKNEFPYAMAMAVAKAPGTTYNPFFLYSNVGLGKTHLVNAIGNYLIKQNPKIQIMYVTCEYFCSHVIDAIKENQVNAFRETFRQMDILLIDDIEFLRDRETAQEEFFHIFNNMVQGGKQVVITSDRPPSELSILKERLQSRFMGGTVACIDSPDLETRIAIIDKKNLELALVAEVKNYLAECFTSNIRELEGALKTLVSMHRLTNIPVDLELVKRVLQEMGQQVKK